MELTCPHGMPSPASCVDCMADGPVAPPTPAPEQRLVATVLTHARYRGYCARNHHHEVEAGDTIGMVEGVGWCCADCIR